MKADRNIFSPVQKDREKAVRTVLQAAFLLIVAGLLIHNILFPARYIVVTAPVTGDGDFIALSYFGVARDSTNTLIGQEKLRAHLQVLRENGYVTISQRDIIDSYQNGKKLPEKSLYLMFEDGRRDTALFAKELLEAFNYRATMFTYAENLTSTDTKFLTGADVQNLLETTYWEQGTNGYRLAYINVFDRYDNYLGELSTYEFDEVQPYLGRDYDHYLMDFIRDKYGVPLESLETMRERVGGDYKLMRDAYEKEVGAMPGAYSIMHANTGMFGTNERASAVNAEYIPGTFALNFNREGDSLNTRESSLYDLTRMQPQSNWSENHLLMRVWDDTSHTIRFVDGDRARKRKWHEVAGASKFDGADIVLTTLPDGRGRLRLRDTAFADAQISVTLGGNVVGTQTIYLRANDDLSEYVSVRLTDNILYLCEKRGRGGEIELFSLDLSQHDGIERLSVEEDRLAAEKQYLLTRARFARYPEEALNALGTYADKRLVMARTVEEGAAAYVPQLGAHVKGTRALAIRLAGEQLEVWVDGLPVAPPVSLTLTGKGSLFLEGSFDHYGYDQRAVVDDVYDAIFSDLVIAEPSQEGVMKIDADALLLYDNRLKGGEAFTATVRGTWRGLVNWFIDAL